MSTDIVRAAPAGLDMVGSLADVERMASTLVKAGGGFIPSHFKNAGQVAAVILAGREMGVPPMAALRSFYLIDGKLGMDASFVLGRMLAAGVTAEWLRNDAECASVKLTRPGSPSYTSTFTKADAERAGLWGRGPWAKYPAAMLRARAVTAGARAYAPDVFAGSVYTAEELRGGQDAPEESEAPPPVFIESRAEAVAVVDVDPIVGFLDAAASEDEVAAIKREVIAPAWRTLDDEQRSVITAAANNAKTRIASGGVREGEAT